MKDVWNERKISCKHFSSKTGRNSKCPEFALLFSPLMATWSKMATNDGADDDDEDDDDYDDDDDVMKNITIYKHIECIEIIST